MNATSGHRDVSLPTGAEEACQWWPEAGGPQRTIFGAKREIGDRATVDTTATQSADGSISGGRVSVDALADRGLTSSEARQMAAVLIETADEIDRWTQPVGTDRR